MTVKIMREAGCQKHILQASASLVRWGSDDVLWPKTWTHVAVVVIIIITLVIHYVLQLRLAGCSKHTCSKMSVVDAALIVSLMSGRMRSGLKYMVFLRVWS